MAFEVTGIDELMNALSQMRGSSFADDAMMEGLKKAGKAVQGTAKALCPVDTGDLRGSIEVTETDNGVDIGTNKEYAPYVEYGTGKKGDPSVSHREDWEGCEPQPFIFPALKANEANIGNIVSGVLQSKINEVL